MTINEWAKKINEWAEGKGWNEDLNDSIESIGKQITNMHSELSEAWEEIKNGRGVTEVWYSINGKPMIEGLLYRDSCIPKPEGFPIEIADAVIRVLHTCERYHVNISRETGAAAYTVNSLINVKPFTAGVDSLGLQLGFLHVYLSSQLVDIYNYNAKMGFYLGCFMAC